MQSLLQRCVLQGGVQVSQHVILVSTRSSNTGQTIDVSHIKGSIRRIINVFFRFLQDELELRGAHKAPAPHRKNILHERRRVFQRPLLRLISFQSLSNAAFCIRDKRMIFPLHAAHDEQRRFADAQQKRARRSYRDSPPNFPTVYVWSITPHSKDNQKQL